MKKISSILVAVLFVLVSLLSFSSNALANTMKTAIGISLGKTVNEKVDSSSSQTKYLWLKFDCLSSNYYDFTVLGVELPLNDVFLTVYDSENNVINSNVNTENE